MVVFAAKRLLRAVVTLWLVVTAIFFGLRLSGDPVVVMLGPDAPAEAYDAMRERLGLNDPAPVQYLRYLSLVVQGDFGDSLREHRSAVQIVLERVPATAQLAVVSLLLSVLIGIPIGICAALFRGRLIDRGLMVLAFLGQSIPVFVFGIALILLFSLWLRVLPSGGKGSLEQILMPAVTLSMFGISSLARLTRSAMLDVVQQDFVRTARAKGASETRIVAVHILRNAAIPVMTVFGLQVGLAISGAVVTETVFSWPGMGRLFAGAVTARDYPVIQFFILFTAAVLVTINLVVDLLYGVVDPRIRR
jgi:peptide/nickel transport system permease protein